METKLLSTGIKYTKLPESYIWPESRRPHLSVASDSETIPIIDVSNTDHCSVVRRIQDACESYGFFQVVGHGVSKEAVEGMVGATEEFFGLPVEEKLKLVYDDSDERKASWLATSFDVKKEEVHNWRDYLFLHCWPLHKYCPHWPTNPPSFRERVSNYCLEVRSLGFQIEELISEGLGLERDYITKVMGEHGQRMAINYYPECPEPEMTFGLQAHTDPNSLTILLQDPHACGLQVLKDGHWLTVKPHPDAFVINIGDQLQALSNGIYKSVWHRAIVNADKPRFSVASFLCPADEALISAPKLLMADGSPSVYRDFTYSEHQKLFWSRKLDQEHCLELLKN